MCSLFYGDGEPTVVCPTRFKEDFLITAEAARFFFAQETKWVAMPEYRLTHHRTIYTELASALDTITKTDAGPVEDFIKVLQKKLKQLRKGELVADTTLAAEALE